MISVFIRNDQIYSKPLEYILAILAKNTSLTLTFIPEKTNAHLVFDHTDALSVPINIKFFDSLLHKKVFNHEAYFQNAPYLLHPESNHPDWLGTAFYMINSFQEYPDAININFLDLYGRFDYEQSYQHKFDCVTKNLVQECFTNFCKEHLPDARPANMERKTKVFVSHDIDTLHGSFLEDGLWALRKGRIDVVFKLIMNEVLLHPHWKNIDKIVKLNSEYDLMSTFFWLATQKVAKNKVKNADYSINKIQDYFKLPANHGLHKSCYTTSFEEELAMLPIRTKWNRYHYLKMNLPSSWNEIENAELELDASLGFADRFGFRNSYSLPFKPYNMSTQAAYNFVEVPLNIMDGTFNRYMKIPIQETASQIIDFIESHKTNAIISIIWHNTYFTNYKYAGYLDEYKKVLLYLYETGIKFITPKEIIDEFGKD